MGRTTKMKSRAKMKPAAKRGLSEKQQLFAQYYAATGNGTRSVMAAGYNVSTSKAASVQAQRLLGNARIQEKIGEFTKARAKRVAEELNINQGGVMSRLRAQLNACPPDFTDLIFDKHGRARMVPKRFEDVPRELWMAVEGIKVNEDGSCYLKFASKTRALEHAAKLLGMHREQIESVVTHRVERIEAAAARAEEHNRKLAAGEYHTDKSHMRSSSPEPRSASGGNGQSGNGNGRPRYSKSPRSINPPERNTGE